MLQSSGKVTRKKLRPVSKLSNQKPSSHQANDASVHTASANHQTSNSNNGASPVRGDSSATLPAQVEQIFEVSMSSVCHVSSQPRI